MKLEYRLFDLKHYDKEIQEIYETSFPENERPPFDMLLSFKEAKFYGVYLDNRLVGLMDTIEYQDIVYLFFLAVSSKERGNGIGSQILTDFKEQYQNRRLFLLADEVSPIYQDYEERKKRFSFYAKNGFHPEGVFIKEFGVRYEYLTHDCKIEKHELLDIMELLIGKDLVDQYYED